MKTTLPEMWWPLMEAPAVKTAWCQVCGSTENLEQHHPVKRSAGELVVNGRKTKKPTVTLCRECHRIAHDECRLHFRWVSRKDALETLFTGHMEYLLSDEPCGYLEALERKGWERCS